VFAYIYDPLDLLVLSPGIPWWGQSFSIAQIAPAPSAKDINKVGWAGAGGKTQPDSACNKQK
jgi:hypothetical protein